MSSRGGQRDSRGLLCLYYDMLRNTGHRTCSVVDGAANIGFEMEVGEGY